MVNRTASSVHCDAKSREVASVLVRCLFALLLLPPRALAQAQTTQPPSDLSQASIEQLMDIEVTSVSRKQQKLSRSAAAIRARHRPALSSDSAAPCRDDCEPLRIILIDCEPGAWAPAGLEEDPV